MSSAAAALHDPYRPSPPAPIADATFLSLLQIDHFVDNRKGYCDPDVTTLRSLLATDLEIDSSKAVSRLKAVALTGEGGIIADLLAVDRLVDRATGKNKGEKENDDLIDDFRFGGDKDIVHPTDVYSTSSTASESCAMMRLLAIDELVDGRNNRRGSLAERESMEQSILLDLLAVDAEMGTATRRNAVKSTSVMEELAAVDAEIDRAASSRSRSGYARHGAKSRTEATTIINGAATSNDDAVIDRPFHSMKRRSSIQHVAAPSAIEADLAAAGLTGTIADLYYTDRRIDGVSDSTNRRDEIGGILELYDTDVVMNRATAGKAGSYSLDLTATDVFMELLSVDRAIDGAKKKSTIEDSGENEAELELYDPTADATMRQIKLHASRDLRDEANIGAVMDLLKVDLAIDGQRRYDIAMEGVTALLEVDRFVDGTKADVERRHDITDVLDLLAVDREVDAAKAARDGPTRQIALDGVDPMEAILATDRLIDGTAERAGRENAEAIFADLHRVDLSVDNLFMPDLPGMNMGPPLPSPQVMKLVGLPPPPGPRPSSEEDATAAAAGGAGGKRSIFSGEEKKGVPSYERQTRDAIRELYKIDQSIDGKKLTRSRKCEMKDVLDLWRVDVEVDQAKAAAARKGDECPPTTPPSTSTSEQTPTVNGAKVAAQDNANGAAQPQPPPKRSIFSSKEKQGAALTNIVGTTTVVNGKERIGSIPLGRTVMSAAKDEFFGKPEMAPPKPAPASSSRVNNKAPLPADKSGPKKGKKGKSGDCSIM